MVARDLRLRRSSDIQRLRARGRSVNSRLLVLTALPNALGHNRYGFTTGKQIRGAVSRNRARRLMREALRRNHTRIAPGNDILLIARNAFAEDTTFAEVAQQLDQLLQRAGLFQEVSACDASPSG